MKRLKSALESVNGWKDEYIFVNDDSTDNSEKILTNLQKDNPIRIEEI